jgi:hypothetical protein
MIGRILRAAALAAGAASLGPALTAMSTAPAAAQQQDGEFMIQVDGWRGGPFARDETGTYAGCRVHKVFDRGLVLVVGTSPEFQSELAILNESWTLEPGSETVARLSVDGAVQRQLAAVAAGPQALVIPVGEDEELYQALRRGSVLTVETDLGQMQFPLSGTARSLSALRQCVERTNELLARNPEAAQPAGEASTRRAMPIDGLVSLLVEAGLEDLGLMLPEAVPDNALNLRFVWRTGPEDAPVIGGLHQAPRGEEVAIDGFAEAYLNTLRAFCPEGFSADLDEAELIGANYALKTGEANCVTARRGEDFVSLIFALDSFNYSVFYHTTAIENRELAEQATGGLEEVLREVAVEFAEAEQERAEDGEAEQPEIDEGGTDEGATDEGGTDGGETGEPEAGEPETGEPETGEPETEEPETGEAETGEPAGQAGDGGTDGGDVTGE